MDRETREPLEDWMLFALVMAIILAMFACILYPIALT